MMNGSSKFKEFLIGFDARRPISEIALFWDEPRKNSYLLKNVDCPLSVDTMVWPSIFDDERIAAEMDHAYRKALGLTGYPLPIWVGKYRPFWFDLAELQRQLQSIVEKDAILIGVSKASENNAQVPEGEIPFRPENYTAQFQGYDVADRAFISAMSNCRYNAMGVAQKRWGAQINERHLFDDFRSALDFKDYSNGKIPEHAPFEVFGIWILDNDASG